MKRLRLGVQVRSQFGGVEFWFVIEGKEERVGLVGSAGGGGRAWGVVGGGKMRMVVMVVMRMVVMMVVRRE